MSDHTARAFSRLVGIMARLRAPDGCPWDLRQTLDSLRAYLVEETYEVLEALDTGDPAEHRDELGDLLFQVIFQSRIREEQGHFTAADVADAMSEKLLRRHPHVFGDVELEDAAAVARSWREIKAREKPRDSALDGVPRALPALLRAQRLGAKAAGVGFDWPEVEGVLAKIREEIAELQEARAAGGQAAVEHEVGDLLMSVVSLARHLDVEPEAALQRANGRFDARFRAMERHLQAEGRAVADTDPATLDRLWEAAKVRVG